MCWTASTAGKSMNMELRGVRKWLFTPLVHVATYLLLQWLVDFGKDCSLLNVMTQ